MFIDGFNNMTHMSRKEAVLFAWEFRKLIRKHLFGTYTKAKRHPLN